MKTNFQPLQLLLMMFSGWVNRHQQTIIYHLLEENRVLKELHKGVRTLHIFDLQRSGIHLNSRNQKI